MVWASRLQGARHNILSKLFRYFPSCSDLDWPPSARASLTESVRMPSTGERGEAGLVQPEYIANDGKQQPRRSKASAMAQGARCSDPFLAIPIWTGQPEPWHRQQNLQGCLRLANQRQRRGRTRAEFSMAARCEWPGHPDPDGPATKASVPEPSAVFDSCVEASATPLSIRSAPFSQGRSHLGFPD